MAENNGVPTGTEPEQVPEPAYTPASPAKRIAAWVGIAYMLILIGLNFYMLANGKMIRGIAPLMLTPAAAGFGGVCLYRGVKGTLRGGLPACIFMVTLCAVATGLGLYLGIPALMENFR